MKFWGNRAHPEGSDRHLRHEFVIGPVCNSSLFAGKTRLYYCSRCKWSFLVCGNRVAVLDEHGEPLVGKESFDRFRTLEEGPCPVLEAFASVALADADKTRMSFGRRYDESGDLGSSPVPARPGRPRPVLRVLTRLREDLGGHL